MTRSLQTPLPAWGSHGDSKLAAVGEPSPPPAFLLAWLQEVTGGRRPPDVRVLDVGCGRGDTVAWLIGQGYDAFGVDVESDYVERGNDHLRRQGLGEGRLRVASGNGAYPFGDGSFDVVLSYQVVEHVADLDLFVREIARVSAPSALGLHNYPARWRPVESHTAVPLAHWLPKGRLRALATELALRVGLGHDYWSDLSVRDRARVFTRYSEDCTYYRSITGVRRAFASAGQDVDVRGAVCRKLRFYRPTWSPLAVRAAAVPFRHLQTVVLETRRQPARTGKVTRRTYALVRPRVPPDLARAALRLSSRR